MTANAGAPATLAVDRAALPAPRQPVLPRSLATVLRLAVHLAAWVPFAVGAIRAVQRGSPVVADGAAIALRSWDVLTPYGPLVGQATQLRHGAFDPGPLQYWLLAIPVHIDPQAGVVWGAALWCMVAASLAVEAAWSAFGAFGALAASGIVVGTVAWQPLVAAEPYWNPWFGVIFFLAALAAGLAVVSGQRRWWPALVLTASVAAQAHLMFALASAALVLVPLVAGLTDTIRARAGYWWVLLGLIAGAACWTAPFIQQFTSRHGNLSLLIASLGARQSAGSAFGLKAVTASALPPAVWWEPAMSTRYEGIAREIGARTPAFAVAALVLTGAVLVLAVRPLRSRRLAALAAVSLLTSGAVLATYSNIPVHNIGRHDQNYLLIVLLPAGLLIWLTMSAAAVLAARRVTDRARVLAALRRWSRGAAGGSAARWGARAAGLAAVALIGLGSWLAVAQQAPASADATSAREVNAARVATQYVERMLPPQRLELTVLRDGVFERDVTLGLAWALRAAGYEPAVDHRAARYLGPRYLFAGRPMPGVTVLMRRRVVLVRLTQGGVTALPEVVLRGRTAAPWSWRGFVGRPSPVRPSVPPAPRRSQLPRWRVRHLALDPAEDYVHHVVAFLRGQFPVFGDLVPAQQAGAAAGSGGVLGDEDRVATVRGLLAVLVRLGGGQALSDELAGVPPDGGRAVQLGGGAVAATQVELRAERVPCDDV